MQPLQRATIFNPFNSPNQSTKNQAKSKILSQGGHSHQYLILIYGNCSILVKFY